MSLEFLTMVLVVVNRTCVNWKAFLKCSAKFLEQASWN